MLSWTREIAVGVEEIDRQHQELFKKANRYFEAAEKGERGAKALEILEFLERYVIEHFRDEERLMRSARYPGLLFHKGEHNYFRNELKEFRQRMTQNPDAPLEAHVLYDLICNWLVTHIQNTDREFGAFLRKNGAHNQPRPEPPESREFSS